MKKDITQEELEAQVVREAQGVLELVDANDIHPYKQNVKIHTEAKIQALAENIHKFGLLNEIAIDKHGTIIAGHARLAAVKLLGWNKVRCKRILHLDEAGVRILRLSDNRTAKGEDDKGILKLELGEIHFMNTKYDITDTGYTTIEADFILDEKPTKAASEKENSAPFVPEEEIVTQRGDIWQIGLHRIICASSLEDETFVRLMDGKLADMVLTDPPYNVSAKSIGSSGKTKHKDFAMAAGEMKESEFENFLYTCMALCAKYSGEKALSYFWIDWKSVETMIRAGRRVYEKFVNLCAWVKKTGGMGKLYRSRHELCTVWGKSAAYTDNVELGKHGRYRTNCWEYDGVNSFGVHKSDLKFHPTVKPYEMFKDIILDASPRGGIILDVFLGSGTTLIAAEKSKRICYGVEYEPIFVDTAIRRFQDLFRIDAIHVESGKTYNELLAEKKLANAVTPIVEVCDE